ncbi:MAG: hypothetical protein QXU48_04590 [Thermoplasmata archaeon]
MKDELPKNPDKMRIRCPCGREITSECVGGQYPEEYRSKCACGREWVLTEISEIMAEINDS